jgi:hypothetical protein
MEYLGSGVLYADRAIAMWCNNIRTVRIGVFCVVRVEANDKVLRRKLEEWELVLRQSPASKDVNTEAEEATGLKAATRRQPVKTEQTEKTSYVL